MARSDVASMVNRSLGGRGNAVSVYSPTRRIRPTGRTANAGTARSILGGGGPVAAPPVGTASFGGAPTPSAQLPGWAAALGGGGAMPTGMPTGGTMLDRIRAQMPTPPPTPDGPGGIKGVLGTVVNNPIGRGALTALNAFNYPRRVIQSSIKEAADALNSGDASFDDWTSQIGDEGFDARDILPQTGVGFLDGLIGFGGDMLMDPLTFVGGAGLWSNLGGKSARAALAGEIIDVGARVGRLTATETAERAARWGISRFDDAARAELKAQLPGTSARILNRGYHFKVPLTQRFIPLPGTAPVDYLIGRGAGRVRDVVTNSRVGQWMRYASTPGGMRDAVTTLTTRHARGGLSFAQAAEVVNWNNGRKLAERSFNNRAARLVDDAVKQLGGGNGGRQAFRDMYRQEADGGTLAHQVYAQIREMGIKEGVHIPEFAGPYLPHYWLPEGRAWFKGESEAATAFRNALYKDVDLDDPLAVAQQRKLIAGKTYNIRGHEFTLTDGSADEINRIFHTIEPNAKHDLIDTDAIAVTQRYINDIAQKVGLLGGMKKLLGSKASLARTLNDDSFADRITDADIDALANRQVAASLKGDWQRATSQLQQFRDDTRRGIKGVGGTATPVVRDAVDGLTTVTAQKKAIFDDAVRELGELEDQVGVGKYAERFNGDVEVPGRGVARRGSLENQYRKTRQVFESERAALERKFAKAETKLAALKRDAALEARRLEAQGNVGATPIQDELRRVSAEQGATANDMEEIQAIIDRLDVTEAAQNVIDRRLGDRDFINVSVADDLSPKSPGSPVNDPTPAAPVYVGPAPAEISTSHNAQRTQILGADDPQVAEIAARFEVQNRAVDRARTNAWRAAHDHGEHVDNTRRLLGEGRQYEAGLKHEIGVLQGRPDQLENSMELSARLEAFQQGELPRLQRDFEDARRPLADAENTLAVQQKKLQEIRDEQMALARTMDARRADPPAPPLTPAGEKTLRSQRRRIVMERNKWSKTPEGVAHTKASKVLKTVSASLEKIGKRIEEITGKGGRFYIDADGVMQPKFTTKEQWALDLMEERRATLVPAREAARARHDAAVETWSRLQRQGASSGEVKAAQRDVSATFKAYKETQYAVTRANRELTKIKDIPDLGRVTAQSDELNRLLGEQAALKSQADDLGQQVTTSGATLRGFEDGIAGIDAQLTAQDTARRLAVEAPATPYGAQIAASHRAEAQRLEQVESQITLARRNWDDAPELPAAPSDLGRFEGQFENPTIRRALEVVGRDDGRRRLYDPIDEVVDVQNSAAAIRAAAEPFTVPPVGTPAHTAVMTFSPASRGGVMGAVGRSQAVTAETQRVLERHIPELVESGAVPAEFGDELFRRRLDLDRALDLHAANPSAHVRAELETQASELGRLTEFALRYKQALDGGNEATPGLGSFILAQQLDDEAASLLRQIEIGNARLATPAGARAELGYSHGLARLNERAAQLTDNIDNEIARGRAGGDWDQRAVRTWTDELERVQRQRDNVGAPANGLLDDTVDSHAAFAADDMRSLNDAADIYQQGRFVDHRMQWPVRRRDELAAAIPHREAQVHSAKQGQRRLDEAVQRARTSGSTTVRYTPYNPEGYPGGVAVMPLAQAEANLAQNERVIGMLEADLVNKQVQASALDGSLDERIRLLEREVADFDTAPDLAEIGAENVAIRQAAQTEQRALTPGELETIASNEARIDRLNRGQPLDVQTQASMRAELEQLTKVRDDFARLMDGDVAHVNVARDPEPFLRGVAAGGGPMSERSLAMLGDVVGPETAAAAKTWIHAIDESFAGRTEVAAEEFAPLLDDMIGVFGDNELIDRMQQRAIASLDADGTISLDEMRDEFTGALIASATRQRGESMRETLSMQSLLGSSFVDGPGGLQPRFAAAVADEPSHALLTARLRTHVIEAMQAKSYDPRNALVDPVADLRTRLGRVETMRRGVEGNEDWLDVALTGTAPAATRARTRATLEAGSEALAAERQGLLAQGEEALARLDPNRAARLAEQQRDLDARVARGESALTDEMTQLRAQTDRVQSQADHAERVYTERLNEVGMQLANVRRRVVEASVDHRAHEEYRTQLVRALNVDPKNTVPSMRAAIDDLQALNDYRRTLGGRAAAAAPSPAAAPVSGPRSLTSEETLAGWADIRPPTDAEVQAVAKMNADARAAGTINWEWYAPHSGRKDRVGAIQLPAGTKAPSGYYATAAPVGPQKLANDLGIGMHVSTGRGVTDPMRAGQDLWALGYRDAADLGGAEPADIINGRIPFQPAAAAPTPPVAVVDEVAELDAIDAQLVAYAEDVKKIENDAQSADALYKGMRHAEANAEVFASVNKALMADGMRIHMRGISHETPEGWAIDNVLANAIENVTKVVETADFWKWLDKYTAFFKTYATAKPGFHVRNAISATFMNLVDGVRLRDMYQGTRLWLQYERDPQFFLKAGVDPRIRNAFDAVFGSGAGGRYAEAHSGVNLQAGSKMYRRLMDNKLTRWNARLGSRVEGSARLSMALNSMYRGATPEQAMRRIAKFHFDYTEMSDLDRMARRLIPFWTFMSRNLPLQLEQMLTNPRMYLQYQSLVRNFGQPMDPATPGYWLSAGAFTVDAHAATRESPWYIAPDLPHLQVTEPLDALMRGEWDKALLSDVNPLIMAPVEAGVIGHKVFSQASLEGYEETSALNPFVPLFNLISTVTPFNPTAKAGSGDTVVAKGAAHVARSLLPPWEFAERLLDPTGKRAGRTDETIYRAFGAPVRQLNDALREGERRSQYYDRRESHQTQAQLARM